jgi:hypothetical protein
VVTEQREDVEWFADVKKAGVVSVPEFLRRVADVIEELDAQPALCLAMKPDTDWVCALRVQHSGYHAATDGVSIHNWLDD